MARGVETGEGREVRALSEETSGSEEREGKIKTQVSVQFERREEKKAWKSVGLV